MTEPAADGWLCHEREQRRAWLALSYRQRLDWLWQAKLFASRALQAAHDRARGTGKPGPGDVPPR